MSPEASLSPAAAGEGDRGGAGSASALVKALEAMRQCKEVALQASRRLFARGLRDGPAPAGDDAEQARSVVALLHASRPPNGLAVRPIEVPQNIAR